MTAKSRKTELARHLRHAILTQKMQPGADLDEVALCARFDLSRTPVREVFRDLDGEGYVTLREGRGARVSGLSHHTLRDFFLAAPMIYGAILRLAARNRTAHQLTELRAAQTDFRNALLTGAPAQRTLANSRFHEVTGDMAGNIYLLPSFRRLLIDHARIGMTFYRPSSKGESHEMTAAANQHDAIITAIETQDETAAGQLAEDHWALSRHQIERFVLPTALDLPLGDVRPRTA